MGSTDDPANNGKAIDASVGALVWVRRRNGSWWPGRIVGLDEISEDCLVSPRSGTPVKLLGRNDASVDWYNLEKSKRVKPFRCGEYDECIEKARVSAENGNKKAVKYARREDAILHALELENALLGKGPLEFSSSNNSGGENVTAAKESPGMSLGQEDENMTCNETGSDDSDQDLGSVSGSASTSDLDSAPELSQYGTSVEEPNHIETSKVQSLEGKRRKTPNDSEDDGTEGIKRMKGLEDLGLGTGDLKAGNCNPNGSHVNGSHVNGSKGCNSPVKKKGSQVSNVHEFFKRRNRRRPLTKVLESTAVVSVAVTNNQIPILGSSPVRDLPNSKISSIESSESRKKFCTVANAKSDSTGNGASVNLSEYADDTHHTNCKAKNENDIASISGLPKHDSSDKILEVPYVLEEKHSTGFPIFVPSSSGRPQVGALEGQFSQNSQVEAACLKINGLNESHSPSSAPILAHNISDKIDKGTSKWQLKGKRNSRHNKSKTRKQGSRKSVDMDDRPNAYLASVEHLDGLFQGPDQKDCDGTRRSLALNSCNLQAKSKLLTEDQLDGVWEWSKYFSRGLAHTRGPDVSVPSQRTLPYRQSRFAVNSRYQTSDLPGKKSSTCSKLYDVMLEVKSNYRPQHVPLVSLTSKLNGKAIVGHPLTVDILDDGYANYLISSSECHATHATVLESAKQGCSVMRYSESGRIPAKHMTKQPIFPASRSPKSRKSGMLSKKTRKLSLLTGNKYEDRKPVIEKFRGPVIACVPLKLVFSRITEAVNGSVRQAHRALASSNS